MGNKPSAAKRPPPVKSPAKKPPASKKVAAKKPAPGKSTRRQKIADARAAAGIDASSADIRPAVVATRDAMLPVGSLFPSRLNPRKSMDAAALRELCDNIVQHGVLQPLLVRPAAAEPDRHEIIIGGRRYAAAMMAVRDGRLSEDFEIPCRIRAATDVELLLLAMSENLQRRDMDPLDEAAGYAALLPGLGGPGAIAERLGVPERTVFRRLALLRLPAGLGWVICGGESGPGARPMHPGWARSLRDQCAAAGVPFFFKQWGEWAPHKPLPGGDLGGDVRAGRVTIVHPTGQSDVEVAEATGGRNTIPGSGYMERVGKKRAGRLLDGRTHDEFPETNRG